MRNTLPSALRHIVARGIERKRIAKQRGNNCLNELLIYQWMSLVPYF